MDHIDRSLIALLTDNARLPIASLAAALGISRATARARLDRLTATGVIAGFTIALGRPVADGVRAITLVEVEGRAAERVMRALHRLPEVRALHATNGRWDIVADIEVETLTAFDSCLRLIREIDGIANTETSILLATRKQSGTTSGNTATANTAVSSKNRRSAP